MERKSIDSLHQQASGQYLEGDYEGALDAWRQLLSLNPEDEQAQEGVRLCERLVADTLGVATSTGADPLADAPTFEDLKTLAESQDGPSFEDFSQPGTDGAHVSEEFQDALRDLDLTVEAVDPDEELVEISSPGDEELVVDDMGPVTTPDALPASTEVGATAELRRRVNELLADALVAMERGDREEALGTINRVLILDEENRAALSLRLKIQGNLPADTGTHAAPGSAAPLEPLEPEPLGQTDLADFGNIELDAGAGHGLVPTPPEVGGVPPTDILGEPEQAFGDLEPTEATASPVSDATPAAPKPKWTPALRGRAMVFGAAGLILVAAAAGGWMLLSGDPSEAAVVEAVRPEPPPAPDGGPTPSPGGDAASGPAAATPPDAELTRIMTEADAAFGAQEYAAAVVGYNAALRIDPDHEMAQKRLVVAGNRFRETQQSQVRWEEARTAFESGNYTRALHLFYRVPDDEQAEVQGFIFNGWYNMGLVALRSENCVEALDHLKEAESIRPREPRLRSALQLARSCRNERGTTSFGVAVNGLPLAGLDD